MQFCCDIEALFSIYSRFHLNPVYLTTSITKKQSTINSNNKFPDTFNDSIRFTNEYFPLVFSAVRFFSMPPKDRRRLIEMKNSLADHNYIYQNFSIRIPGWILSKLAKNWVI